jgi:hypothetical protein
LPGLPLKWLKILNKIVDTKLAIDSADDAKYGRIKDGVNRVGAKSSELWSKFDKFRVNKILENFKSTDAVNIKYQESKVWPD